jgi:hypothetical protein
VEPKEGHIYRDGETVWLYANGKFYRFTEDITSLRPGGEFVLDDNGMIVTVKRATQ